jgi:hypothetical protein
MKTVLITLALLLATATPIVAGDYYKWVDDTGTVHYSDSGEVPPQYRNQIEGGSLPDAPQGEAEPPAEAPSAVPDEVAAEPSATANEGAAEPSATANEAAAASPATADEAAATPSAPPETEKFEVKYQEYEGRARRILVQARLNDRITANMALDTGSPDTMISAALAARLGLFDGDHGTLLVSTGGIGGSAPAIRVVLDKVEIGGATNQFVPATVVATSISPAFDGLIGMGFVSSYQVHIDPTRHVVTFQGLPPSDDAPAGRDEQWWRNTFKDFALYKNGWKQYRDYLRHESRSPSGGISDPARLKEQQALADTQLREAERLYDKLKRYAVQHYVPMAWRE